MDKFNRVYSLRVETEFVLETGRNRNLEITLPYTLEFEITRRLLTSAQTGLFRIYNLGEQNRNAIQKDVFQFTQRRSIQFRAGYDSPWGRFQALAFNGTVLTAYSYRKDRDWITEIEAYDGGWQSANGEAVSTTISPGQSAAQTITNLSKQIPYNSGVPIVGSFPTENLRGEALFGNIWELIIQKSNGKATIDNGQVKALQNNEVIVGEIPLVSADTGLLGSPKRTISTLDFDMIFEPRLTVGQILVIQSAASRQFNRPWKVQGFTHRGTISPAVAGDAVTSVNLWFTTEELREVAGTPVTQ